MSGLLPARGRPEASAILPLLRPRDRWRVPGYEALVLERPEIEVVAWKFSPFLDLLLCVPDSTAFRFVTLADLAELHLDREEARAVAAGNIDARRGGYFFSAKDGALTSVSLPVPGARLLDQRGSGIMLAAGFWREIAASSPRPLLAGVFNRDFVQVSFLNAEANLPGLREVFRSLWESEDHPLSPELFRWNGGGWDLA